MIIMRLESEGRGDNNEVNVVVVVDDDDNDDITQRGGWIKKFVKCGEIKIK